MKATGTVRRSDLAGGHWTLETDGGETYQLAGSSKELGALKDGMRAEISGSIDRGAMGIGMTGPHLKISKITAL